VAESQVGPFGISSLWIALARATSSNAQFQLQRFCSERIKYTSVSLCSRREPKPFDVVIYGERHLRQLVLAYMAYYNFAGSHLSLDKDTPVSRAIQAGGRIRASPILGGLPHR
jgi:hypothetical protein